MILVSAKQNERYLLLKQNERYLILKQNDRYLSHKKWFCIFLFFFIYFLRIFCSHVNMTPQKIFLSSCKSLRSFFRLTREKFICAIFKMSTLRTAAFCLFDSFLSQNSFPVENMTKGKFICCKTWQMTSSDQYQLQKC